MPRGRATLYAPRLWRIPRKPQPTPSPRSSCTCISRATVRPETLLEIARRNDFALPAGSPGGSAISIATGTSTTSSRSGSPPRTRSRRRTTSARSSSTTPPRRRSTGRRTSRGSSRRSSAHGAGFPGTTSSRATATAPRKPGMHGVEVLLTPDVTRAAPVEDGFELVRQAAKYKERGIVGIGLGGEERSTRRRSSRPSSRSSARRGSARFRTRGVAGPESVRGAIDVLHADRVRHGIRTVEDPGLRRGARRAARRPRRHAALQPAHRRRPVARCASASELVAARIRARSRPTIPRCSTPISRASTRAALSLGIDPKTLYEAGVEGALCSEDSRAATGSRRAYDWSAVGAEATA